jgi:putative aminopeptidase FrvX
VDSLVTSDSPLEPSRIGRLKLGRGAALRALDSSGMTSRIEVERVLALARSEGIPVQVGVTAGGNDGARFPRVGAANVPLSFPLRYSHSSAETADLGDIRALISLIEALTLDELRSDPARVVQ